MLFDQIGYAVRWDTQPLKNRDYTTPEETVFLTKEETPELKATNDSGKLLKSLNNSWNGIPPT